MKKVVVIVLTLLIISTSTAAFAADAANESPGKSIIIDALILRPVGFATCIIGGVFYVLTLPVAAITGSVGKTTQALVVKPFNYTFERAMGDNDWKKK